MKASRPKCVIVYFITEAIETTKDGTVYFFLATDGYSQYVFTLGGSPELTDKVFIQYIDELLKHKDFVRHSGNYKLVIPFRAHLEPAISKLIAPHGSLIIDE